MTVMHCWNVHKAGEFHQGWRARAMIPPTSKPRFEVSMGTWTTYDYIVIHIKIYNIYIYLYQYIYIYVYCVMCIPNQIYFNCSCIIRLDTTFQPLLQPPTQPRVPHIFHREVVQAPFTWNFTSN